MQPCARCIIDASGVEPKAAPGGQDGRIRGMSDGGIDAGEPGGGEPPRRLSGGRCVPEPRAVPGTGPGQAVRSTLPEAEAVLSAGTTAGGAERSAGVLRRSARTSAAGTAPGGARAGARRSRHPATHPCEARCGVACHGSGTARRRRRRRKRGARWRRRPERCGRKRTHRRSASVSEPEHERGAKRARGRRRCATDVRKKKRAAPPPERRRGPRCAAVRLRGGRGCRAAAPCRRGSR